MHRQHNWVCDFGPAKEKRLRAMSDISNRSEGNGETAQNADMDTGRPTTPRGRPGNLLNTIRLAEDVPLGEQLSLLWKNKLFCRATMAFASSNYINAGLAFIWIRLFIQLWSMERQISTVSFLAITGGGQSCRKGRDVQAQNYDRVQH